MRIDMIRIYQDAKSYLREFRVVATKPALDALAVFGGIAGVASAFLDTSSANGEERLLAETAVSWCVGLFLVSLFFIAVYAVFRIRMKTSTQVVPFAHDTYLHVVMEGDYLKNLESFLERQTNGEGASRYPDVVCVCGLSNDVSLEHLTDGSVVRSLMRKIVVQTSERTAEDVITMSCEDLAREHAVSALQEQLDKEVGRMGGRSSGSGPTFGDCFIVRYDEDELRDPNASTLSPDYDARFPKRFRIMFLINCRVNTDACVSDPNAIDGPASTLLMHCIFDRLENEYLDLLFIPVLGTRRLNNSHQGVITSIVHNYCSRVPTTRRYYDLAISVNGRSMERDGLSLVRLRRYVKEALRFYN